MKNFLVTLILVSGLSIGTFAQVPDWGIGLRFGSPSAFTVKHYFGQNAWDLSVGTGYHSFYNHPNGRYRGLGFSAMFNYLWRRDIDRSSGVEWYYGIGGLLTNRTYYRDNDRTDSYFGVGATGALGLEWFIPNAPISLFLEANPYVEVLPSPFYITLGGGIGGRFTF